MASIGKIPTCISEFFRHACRKNSFREYLSAILGIKIAHRLVKRVFFHNS